MEAGTGEAVQRMIGNGGQGAGGGQRAVDIGQHATDTAQGRGVDGMEGLHGCAL